MSNRGRPRLSQSGKAINTTVVLTPEDRDYLLSINHNISKAIRSIIAAERELTALERNRNDDNADCQ